MPRPQPTPGLDRSLETMRIGGDPPASDDRRRPFVEATPLARWENEGGALRESEQRAS